MLPQYSVNVYRYNDRLQGFDTTVEYALEPKTDVEMSLLRAPIWVPGEREIREMVPIRKSFAIINATGTIIVQHTVIIHADYLMTSSLPLVTTGQPHAGCSGYVHDDSKVSFLALDPYHRRKLGLSDGSCLSSEDSSLWQQDKSPTGTSLGPEGYYTVTTSNTDESLEHVFYYPSHRIPSLLRESLYSSQTRKYVFPSQHITMISAGSTLESERKWTTTVTTTKSDETISVLAVPVKGWAYISPAGLRFTAPTIELMMMLTMFITTSTSTCAETADSPQSTTTASDSFFRVKSSTTTPSYSTPSASGWSPSSNDGHAGYSQGDKIELGVGIGVGLGVGLPSLILAFVQYRRTRPEVNIIPVTARDNTERE
ncbi:hypothetical protein FHL15_008874 [Xylaria flabelliformis]|uniref:Uncharacterized protein n=1 Tax=Xylaria flabelliformis TaxID=2512241 RepID=A0A553HQB8_9PEZI|nr:hypothetical protein FHL15_008874 [Xylaria flabelliformis]